MYRLNLAEPVTIQKNGQDVLLNLPMYNVQDLKLLQDNGFFKCHKCKEWFDKICEYGFPTDDQKNKTWCESHFPG